MSAIAPTRALIVDDDGVWVSKLREILTQSSIAVKSASCMNEAATAMRKFKPERFLIDLHLGTSSADGLTLISFLENIVEEGSILIIANACPSSIEERCLQFRSVAGIVKKPEIFNSFDKINDFFENSIIEKVFTRLLERSRSGDQRLGRAAIDSQGVSKNSVFVVSGRNKAAVKAVFDFLRALGIKPLGWNEAITLTKKASPLISEILDSGFEHAQAVLVLLTGDDEARLRKNYLESQNEGELDEERTRQQPRMNVIFEAGLALGKQPDRTILLKIGNVHLFTDISGRHFVEFKAEGVTRDDRQSLVSVLRLAGVETDTSSSLDWLDAGDFSFLSDE